MVRSRVKERTPPQHGGAEADGGAGPQPVVRVRGLSKRFRRESGAIVRAIDDVSLDVFPGDFVVLLGPSGCGKTTLLRSIAGLERPDAGTIEIHGKTNFSAAQGVEVPPERRRLNMIFQSYALWPHMTAFGNVAYPLQSMRKERPAKAEISDRVSEVLELLGIGELAQQYPNQMSGGQQQRVALARALVRGDDLILFDEPLSNVDAKVREQLRLELVAMQRKLNFSALFVTHDQVEAMELASDIAVMREGQIAQFATPIEVYQRPRTRYVANFIGTTNEIEGAVVSRDGDVVEVDTPLGPVHGRAGDDSLSVGDAVVALWRPERCALSEDEPSADNRWETVVAASVFVGSHTQHVLDADGSTFRVWSAGHDMQDLIEAGTPRWLGVDARYVRVLPAAEPRASESAAE